MSVVVRLSRAGKKKKPYYHVVVTDSRTARDSGNIIEAIGAYDPNLEPPKFEVNEERLSHWVKCGATPSETVSGLIKLSKRQQPAKA